MKQPLCSPGQYSSLFPSSCDLTAGISSKAPSSIQTEAKIHPLTTTSHSLPVVAHVCCPVVPSLGVSLFSGRFLCPVSHSLMLLLSALSLCAAPCWVRLCHFKFHRWWSLCCAAPQCWGVRAHPESWEFISLNTGLHFPNNSGFGLLRQQKNSRFSNMPHLLIL